MKIRVLLVLSFLLVGCVGLHGQSIPRNTIQVRENGRILANPDAGGLNVPNISEIDLNLDNKMDLLFYDREGKVYIPFVNTGSTGQTSYAFAPEYISAFPIHNADFVLCRDFDCDGKQDLFLGTISGIKAYRNTSNTSLSFSLHSDTLYTDYGGGRVGVYVSQGDVPEFVDVDGDSDLDMLTFDAGGSYVEWHKNRSMETNGNCAGIDLILADACWGKFQESGLNQNVTLGISCRRGPGGPVIDPRAGVHTGSSLAAFDEDNNGVYELVLGDLSFSGLTYLHNSGTNVAAYMDTSYAGFPSYDIPVDITNFPAAFFLDVNNDGKKDMLSVPNVLNVGFNYDNCWVYDNISTNGGVQLTRLKKSFMVDDMIDVGKNSHPRFFDYNQDGLQDLVIGNFNKKVSSAFLETGLALYKNVGTAANPEFSLITDDFGNLNAAFNPQALGLIPTFGDLDADGDEDMILGDSEGKLHFLENTAPSGQAANFASPLANYKGIDVGQHAAPCLVDVDRDGKLDLIVGETSGRIQYFHNIGTAQVADFASTPTDNKWGFVDTEPNCCTGHAVPFVFTNPAGYYDLLVGSEAGNILYFANIEPQYGDTFVVTETRFGGIREGIRTSISCTDLDGDGQLDWVVGNQRGGIGLYEGNGPVPTGLESRVQDWEVYPNPTNGQLKILIDGLTTGKLEVRLMDLQGRILLVEGLQSGGYQNAIELSGLAQGSYFLQLLQDGEFVGVKRVVLQR